MTNAGPRLARRITLPLLVLYGVGTMVGGGFYALVGKVAGHAGYHAPLSMLVAGLLALPSALSFSELSARFPVSAGESVYMQRAFGLRWLAVLVGWMVIATGVVSAATLANAMVSFVQDRTDLHRELGILIAVVVLGAIAAKGIGMSVAVAVTITIIEVGGLVYVVAVATAGGGGGDLQVTEVLAPVAAEAWSGILLGGFLVFYAFLGFEDLVNMAEEVERPRRSLPIAILWTLAVTTSIYFVVTWSAVATVPLDILAQSKSPLADVVERAGGHARWPISMIGVLAGVNGALVQVVMAARVAYGMSDKGMGPRLLARIHPWTRTPLWATGLVSVLVLALALWFPLVTLAQATSAIILVVFASVNLALLVLKGREPAPSTEGPCYPRWVPLSGLVASLGFLGFRVIG